jgi:hypothetical protein
MTKFFQFEADFVDSLGCIPMVVRFKLDTCGLKLKLTHWHQFTHQQREKLVTMPCNSPAESQTYRDFLQQLVIDKTGSPAKELPIEEHPPWLNEATIPENVLDKAAEFDLSLSLEQWKNLTPLQRFSLIKLSRPGHENHNFYPALQEFDLI